MSTFSQVQALGAAPTVEAVEQWFEDNGFAKNKVGKSTKGRDINIFRLKIGSHQRKEHGSKAVLFMSLIHGNEPIGLINLLYTAASLQSEEVHGKLRKLAEEEVELIFMPFINIDAYAINIEFGRGCRRNNMHRTCTRPGREIPVERCPMEKEDGVNINRNFDFDFIHDVKHPCKPNYQGLKPFSERETMAVRDVVQRYQPIAAMQYNAWATNEENPVIMYPYASDFEHTMPTEDLERFKSWGESLLGGDAEFAAAAAKHHGRDKGGYSKYSNTTSHKQIFHAVGRPIDVAGFTRRGSLGDWMYEKEGIMSFVHQAIPPCNQHWCITEKHAGKMHSNAIAFAESGQILVELVLDYTRPADFGDHPHHYFATFAFLVFVIFSFVGLKFEKSGGLTMFLLKVRAQLEKARNQYDVEMAREKKPFIAPRAAYFSRLVQRRKSDT